MMRAGQAIRHQATTHNLHAIAGGDQGTRQTLIVMRDLVRDYRKHPRIRDLAKRITARCQGRQYSCEAKRLHAWVRDRVKYVRDINDVETVQTPIKTLVDGSGDCDDQVVLFGSLLESIGHPVRFVAAAFQPGAAFAHVFLETRLGPYWVAGETTEKWVFGKRPPGIARHMVMKV